MVAENIVVLKNVFDSGFTILGAVDRNADLRESLVGAGLLRRIRTGLSQSAKTELVTEPSRRPFKAERP